MATWQQVKSYIFANYQVKSDSGENLVLDFETEPGRTQTLYVGYLDADMLSSIMFSSPFASLSNVPAEQILRATAQAGAAIRCIGEYVAVTHSQFIATIDESEIDLPMVLVTSQADRLEQMLGQGDRF